MGARKIENFQEDRNKRGGEDKIDWLEYEDIEERDRRMYKEKRWEKIRGSRYNKWYKYVKGEGILEYLKKGCKEEKWKRIIRYRMRNGMREGLYWKEE